MQGIKLKKTPTPLRNWTFSEELCGGYVCVLYTTHTSKTKKLTCVKEIPNIKGYIFK